MSPKLQSTPALPKPEDQHEFPLSIAGFHFSLFTSVQAISKDWEKAQPQNLFLQRPFLSVIEENPPRGMRFSYLVFYQDKIPVGIAYCQISNFRPDRSIRDSGSQDKYPCIIRAFARFFKNLVASQFDHNLLVCGNLLLTGEHGFFFDFEKVDKATAFSIIEEALILVQKYWERENLTIDGIFIKDVQENHRAPSRVLVERKFREFTFHPNMVLHLPESWNTFDDYLNAISSKYRVRAKRAFRLAADLERRELSESQIIANRTRFYELYLDVMDNAGFNMTTLHENYLPDLKRKLGDAFKVFGYFQNGELVGYRTTILNGEELEAHFLGFEQTCNKSCQIYLNMLFDTLRQGIELKARRIVYARTAMEIKSSVGAIPHEMFCYIRANNRLTNKILPPLLEYLRPPDNWVPRNPFKDSPEETA